MFFECLKNKKMINKIIHFFIKKNSQSQMNRLDTIFAIFFMLFLLFLVWFFTRMFVSKYGSILPTTNTGTTGTATGVNSGVSRTHVHDYYSDYPWFLTSIIGCLYLATNNDAIFGLTIIYTLFKIIGSFMHNNYDNLNLGRRILWYISNIVILALFITSFVGYGDLRNNNAGGQFSNTK
jgi:hypothetical protein